MSNKLVEVRKQLDSMTSQFEKVLPGHVTVDKFVRTVNTALAGNDYLLGLDRGSLFKACLQCAADGLMPDGKEAALVPFQGKITYSPMVAGILKKIRNSGELKSLASAVVYANDLFEYYTDESGEKFMHKPLIVGDRGKIIGVYAQAILKSEGRYFEFMTEDQIEDIRKMVPAVQKGKQTPWTGPFADEMYRKTVIRRLSKRLPMSSDQEKIVKRDDQYYDLALAQPRDITPQLDTPSNLKHILAPETAEVEVVEEI
jgi:recombination protein RecT